MPIALLNRETPASDLYDKGSGFGLSLPVPLREAALNQPLFRRVWGGATGWLARPRKLGWADLLFLLVVVALAMGIFNAAEEWGAPRNPRIEPTLDLSPWSLPLYTFYSLMRGLIAYVLSLVFTLVYGYWAAKDRVAQRVLVPLLDILQSIPVLGFAPPSSSYSSPCSPNNNVGLEIARHHRHLHRPGLEHDVQLLSVGAIRARGHAGGGHGLPLQLVAALPLGRIAVFRPSA